MNETGDMDALAAEYVLGTLESGERAQALALLGIDQGFADKVRMWERRLSELHLMVEPIEPDGKIWERIKPKLPVTSQMAEMLLPEAPRPPEATDDATPSGVFDDLPTPATTIPAAPQLPSSLPSSASDADGKPTPAPVALPMPAPVAIPSPPVIPPAAPDRVTTAVPPAAPAARRGHTGLWKALTAVMTLIVVAFVGLFAAWRLAPDQLPVPLRPLEVMRELGVAIPSGPPPQPPAPPESQFDE
jgi:hypothetical protein